ncbi:shikimate dehydrogenase [Magnetospirillum molischianum]|uniref:Shikimate dehydrogenase (NADP(+)) n=1 Tax=Magnetospirillum molischianum DSM 120 TaxID=1150626 RepID=H8FTF8_MAGML|nr:shikimate dehydrogenase [Magnetospirillum molischianum]CCG41646.1 Shikimate dehydrogenase [Magnetospirillum molischianum DSM 120]
MILTGKARLAGVAGWPVGHSRSPRLHGFWLEKLGIDGAYLPLAIAPEDLTQAIVTLPKLGFRGINLTIPHKEAVLPLLDTIEPLAARIGAVNTLIFKENGTVEGRNTDAFGFLENLRRGAPHWHPHDGPAVVIGAGGAARAVIAALTDAGLNEIRLVNRSRDRAERLARDLGGPVIVGDWEKRASLLEGAALLVNTTSLGMAGQPPLDLDLAALPLSAIVTDIVYVPLETPLLAAARKRGNLAIDGLGMLLWQAVPGFSAWFGTEPEVTDELRAFVLSDQ